MSLIQVPVPEELVVAVYDFIASKAKTSAMGGGDRSSADESIESFDEPILRRILKESPPVMRAFLQTLASQAGHQLSLKDISGPVSKALGRQYGAKQLGNALGPFSKRMKNRYGLPWPFVMEWDHEKGYALYRMSKRVAEIIRRVSER